MGGNDEGDSSRARTIILARRARFLAAAVASVGIACGKDSGPPQPCLSQPYIAPDAEPMPCLSPIAVEPDAAAPRPCLEPMPADAGEPEPPRPCLSPPPYNPPDAGKPPKIPDGGPPGPPPRPCLTPKRGP